MSICTSGRGFTVVHDSTSYDLSSPKWTTYCIRGYFYGGFISANFARQSSQKFPL